MLKNGTKLNYYDIDNRIRENLHRLRLERGLSIHDLGKLSRVPYINRIESGQKPAGKHVVIRLAEALKVDIVEFYRPTKKPPPRAEQVMQIFGVLSQEGQTHLLEVAKSIAAYEMRLKWRE